MIHVMNEIKQDFGVWVKAMEPSSTHWKSP